MKLILTAFILLFASTLFAQLSKKQVTEHINQWYDHNAEKYFLTIGGEEASAIITRYHPEQPEEKNDLIEIFYLGMEVQLGFDKDLEKISTHKDSLQKYFKYVALTNIYNEIPSSGWDIYPQTPTSSLRGEGLIFNSGGDSISLTINWSSYTVMGYRNTQKCDDELSMADNSISEECYVSVRKNMPLEVRISKTMLKSN